MPGCWHASPLPPSPLPPNTAGVKPRCWGVWDRLLQWKGHQVVFHVDGQVLAQLNSLTSTARTHQQRDHLLGGEGHQVVFCADGQVLAQLGHPPQLRHLVLVPQLRQNGLRRREGRGGEGRARGGGWAGWVRWQSCRDVARSSLQPSARCSTAAADGSQVACERMLKWVRRSAGVEKRGQHNEGPSRSDQAKRAVGAASNPPARAARHP